MGYLSFCSQIVFGFHDIQCGWGNGKILDRDSVPEGICVYAGKINKGYNIAPVIGIECEISKTGQLTYDPKHFEVLMAFIERCKTYYTSVGISEEIIRKLVVPSFKSVIDGDWECKGIYSIDKEVEDEDEEDEDEEDEDEDDDEDEEGDDEDEEGDDEDEEDDDEDDNTTPAGGAGENL